jgi:uncharacterized protein (DUF362 family)
MKRREFIRRTGAAGSLFAGTQLMAASRPEDGYTAPLGTGEDKPLVSLCGSNDPQLRNPVPLGDSLTTEQVRDIVWLALDRDISPRCLKKIVKKDSWVMIKPNIVTCNSPSMKDFPAEGVLHWGLVTDLRVIKALAEYLVEKVGPKRITIGEGGVWPKVGDKGRPEITLDGWNCPWEEFGNLSYEGIVKEMNGKQKTTHFDIIDFEDDRGVYVKIPDPHKSGISSYQDVTPGNQDGTSKDAWSKRQGWTVAKSAVDCDIMITVPVMKTHSSAGVTLCLKNLMGCIHNQSYGIKRSKAPMHQGTNFGLVRGLADLACVIEPDYAVVEGIWSTEHQHLGQNGVNVNHNVIVAGGDVVAVEAVTYQIMGFNPLDSDLLRMMNRKKMGEWNPDSISVAGPSAKSLSRNFIRAANTYFARGVRKWLISGPFSRPFEKPESLKPRTGDSLSGIPWILLDGDAIIDAGSNAFTRPSRTSLQKCLLYGVPGSDKAPDGSVYYLALRILTSRKDLCGQLLVGLEGGEVKAFFNERQMAFDRDPMPYSPTPMPFIKLFEGENMLVLELTKAKGEEKIKLAVNICDLDGDRLADITFIPSGEGTIQYADRNG